MSNQSMLQGSLFTIVLPLVFAATTGAALADCKSGYVWREAYSGDVVCVTPTERQEAKDENAAGPGHTN